MAETKGIMQYVGDAAPEDYAGHLVPCVYADGIMSLSWAPHAAKFYFGRFDSPPQGKDGIASLPIAQVVMPVDGLCYMTQFLVKRLDSLKNHDTLRKETLTEIKKICDAALSA